MLCHGWDWQNPQALRLFLGCLWPLRVLHRPPIISIPRHRRRGSGFGPLHSHYSDGQLRPKHFFRPQGVEWIRAESVIEGGFERFY